MGNSKPSTQNSQLSFPPPWRLSGSMALLLSKRGAVMVVHYESSPVGPYDEWAVGVLTRRGPRIVEMLVTSEDSRRGGRENWGFPKELASLQWRQLGKHLEFQTVREIYRLRAWGPGFPLSAKGFCVQTLNGQEVRVPMQIQGRARLAWRGRQIALLIEEFVFNVEGPEKLTIDE
jgi:hypothetical protein